MEGMGMRFRAQGSQTNDPQLRQLCLSRACCASLSDVLAHVKRLAQQALSPIAHGICKTLATHDHESGRDRSQLLTKYRLHRRPSIAADIQARFLHWQLPRAHHSSSLFCGPQAYSPPCLFSATHGMCEEHMWPCRHL
jgi:hypothetical protein